MRASSGTVAALVTAADDLVVDDDLRAPRRDRGRRRRARRRRNRFTWPRVSMRHTSSWPRKQPFVNDTASRSRNASCGIVVSSRSTPRRGTPASIRAASYAPGANGSTPAPTSASRASRTASAGPSDVDARPSSASRLGRPPVAPHDVTVGGVGNVDVRRRGTRGPPRVHEPRAGRRCRCGPRSRPSPGSGTGAATPRAASPKPGSQSSHQTSSPTRSSAEGDVELALRGQQQRADTARRPSTPVEVLRHEALRNEVASGPASRPRDPMTRALGAARCSRASRGRAS